MTRETRSSQTSLAWIAPATIRCSCASSGRAETSLSLSLSSPLSSTGCARSSSLWVRTVWWRRETISAVQRYLAPQVSHTETIDWMLRGPWVMDINTLKDPLNKTSMEYKWGYCCTNKPVTQYWYWPRQRLVTQSENVNEQRCITFEWGDGNGVRRILALTRGINIHARTPQLPTWITPLQDYNYRNTFTCPIISWMDLWVI